VLLVGYWQAGPAGEIAHVALEQIAEREHDVGKIRGGDRVQEVALILSGIPSLTQLRRAVDDRQPRVMAPRDPRRAPPRGVTTHDAEFDLAIAEHIRIRGAALAVLVEEVGEYLIAILACEVDSMQRQTELAANLSRVVKIASVVAIAVVFPVAHVQTLDGV